MKLILRLAIWIAAAASLLCAEPIASLHATNYVNDFAGVLDASTEARLNDLCRQVDEKAKAQIAVAVVKSTDGQEVFDYGVALYQAWGIGKKGSDRGVLILLATQDHKYWIHTGYGLEGILPDGKVGGFGREAVPLLRSGDYDGAVTLMTSRVAEVIAQDAGVTLEGLQAQQTPRAPPKANGPAGIAPLHPAGDCSFNCVGALADAWREWMFVGAVLGNVDERRWWRRLPRRRRLGRRRIWRRWWRIWRVWWRQYWRRRSGRQLVGRRRVENALIVNALMTEITKFIEDCDGSGKTDC